ncbi:MAG TPA: LysM peptidoglycan-binding domain-containing protein [Chloroflexia bacterium]|nr:LysM peptidoglycan-binding domain-containing protein [Chloroflexia bacterium]
MQQTQNNESDASDSKSRSVTGILTQSDPASTQLTTGRDRNKKAADYTRSALSRIAVDEARQMLDEIAGLPQVEGASRSRPQDAGTRVRSILLWPFLALWSVLKFLFTPVRQADYRLTREMLHFLRHPGHFFWFNRLSPETASQRFGTTSTDAMTHHARRYGAHLAMLFLALVVVLFGGFSAYTTVINSEFIDVPHAQMLDGSLVITGEGREIYASAVASNSKAFTRRMETVLVKDGETLRSIATAHNISLETILFANNIIDPDTEVTPGQRLVVPPITGMLHITNPGDTVGKIADIYGVDPKTILSYKPNNLEGADASTTLKPLQEVMVPGGSMPLRTKLYVYTIKPGDTTKSIAEKFGLNTQTLDKNNDLSKGLKPGQQITILPVDGLIYTVKKGDTLDGVARYLGTSVDNIVNFKPNNVARGIALQSGQSLVVPGGDWPPPPPPTPAPQAKPAQVAGSQGSKNTGTANRAPATAPKAVSNAGRATGSMVWPMRGVITTYFGQPIWYGIHKGLDISTGCGTPVIAADGGTVVEAGWSPYGYGINAVIDHGNGIRTRYGHFSRVAVFLGQRVAKGQLVGYEGTTGNSTGCHLHFEVVVRGSYTDPLRWLR